MRPSRWIGLLLAGLLLLQGCSSDTSVAPPKPPADSTSGRAAAAQETLDALDRALASGDATGAAGLGVPQARTLLEAVAGNVAKLHLTDVSFRVIDDESELSDSDRELYGSSAWPASVELTYRLGGWDPGPSRIETRVVFAQSAGRELVAGLGGGDDRTPLWLTGPVTPLSSARALVIARGDQGRRYLGLARQALVDVAKVLPRWHGKLVVEAPATEEQLDQALAAAQDRYANIAAVTTTVDGSVVPGTPVHVFLNPRVFDGLGPRGSQVVLSHESTHVATGAVFANLPTWLLEGFADYVALDHAGIPVKTAASQILARIRKHGPPDRLPTSADLDPSASGLGATYEEAWLATRFLSQEYGEPKLVTFYQRASTGVPVERLFRTVLGTTEARFVERWRADLRVLADGVAG